MKRHKLLLLINLIFFLACTQHSKQKEVHIGNIMLVIRDEMEVIPRNGIDSHTGYIINKHNDTFHFEYGKRNVVNRLFEPMPIVFGKEQKELFKRNFNAEPTREEALFSDSPKEDMQQNIFDANYYMYDTLHGIVTKIIQPKVIRKGITGMYVLNLKDSCAFSIYAVDLDSSENIEALKFFRTINYR